MINIIFIIIIIILIIIYINKNKKKEKFTTTSSEILSTNDIITQYILKNNIEIQATRNLIEFIKYLYPNEQNMILPADTIINSNFNTDEIIVENNCTIEDSVEIDNLIVDGNVYIKNKDNYYDINKTEDNKNMILDILPIGSIIPWTSTKLPVGWILCDGKSYTSEDGLIDILTPSINKNDLTLPYQKIDGRIIMGCSSSLDIDQTGGADEIKLDFNYLPIHNHEMILNFTTMEECKPNDLDPTKCKYSGFRFGTLSDQHYAEGNTNSILSFSPQYEVHPILDTIYSAKCILYIIKIF